MKIGYAQVSIKDQNLNLQIDALKKAGVDEIHTEIVSDAKTDRPVLVKILKKLRADDVLVIRKLDQLGHSIRLVDLIPMLTERRIELLSLHEHIDTTTTDAASPSPLNYYNSALNLVNEATEEGVDRRNI